MSFLPISLRVEGSRCVVFGTDGEAARRVRSLTDAGASIVVIGDKGDSAFEGLCSKLKVVERELRRYRKGDLKDAALVFVCGPDAPTEEIAAEAAERSLLMNVADVPQRCSFIMPAVHRQGAVVVAVSTAGASPALARRVRDQIATQIGPEYGQAAELLASLRERFAGGAERGLAFARLLDEGLLEALRSGDAARVERLTERVGIELKRGSRGRGA